jgi:hypothetical protein
MSKAAFNSNPISGEERYRQAEELLDRLADVRDRMNIREKEIYESMKSKLGEEAFTDRMIYWLRDCVEKLDA